MRVTLSKLAVCVDYDGTVTDLDTFDVLVAANAGADDWDHYEARLRGGTMTLRDVLATQASFVRSSLDEADALLAARTRIDPAFVAFVERCERERVPLAVLSSGIASLIQRAFERNGLMHVPVYANDAIPSTSGWTMTFRDDSDNGHDKAAAVRQLQSDGYRVAFVGDGHSDFDAALAADQRFARTGHALERFLQMQGATFTPFTSFVDVNTALFS